MRPISQKINEVSRFADFEIVRFFVTWTWLKFLIMWRGSISHWKLWGGALRRILYPIWLILPVCYVKGRRICYGDKVRTLFDHVVVKQSWEEVVSKISEKVNLLLVALASHSYKAAVRSDIPVHNQFIPAEHLKTKEYLEKIKDWTTKQKMILNQKKTKVMIFYRQMQVYNKSKFKWWKSWGCKTSKTLGCNNKWWPQVG